MTQAEAAGEAQKPRIAKRYKVFEATRMHAPSGEARVHLINISESGALLHAASAAVPIPGAAVRLEISGQEMPARVVWADGDRFGVMFLRRLSAECIARLIRS
jgi:hypothetical protein